MVLIIIYIGFPLHKLKTENGFVVLFMFVKFPVINVKYDFNHGKYFGLKNVINAGKILPLNILSGYKEENKKLRRVIQART